MSRSLSIVLVFFHKEVSILFLNIWNIELLSVSIDGISRKNLSLLWSSECPQLLFSKLDWFRLRDLSFMKIFLDVLR